MAVNHPRMLVQSVLIVAGCAFIAASLNDVFQSVIVPRAVGRRLRPSYYSARLLWRIWPPIGRAIYRNDDDKTEDFLAVFAPSNLIITLMIWSLLLLVGYGLIFYALRAQVHGRIDSPLDAFYFAGTSFFTIGFGDYVGSTTITRLVSLAAGASGFGVISTTTAYLFAIFGAFQVREQFVVTTGARAGSPPSGVGLLAIAKRAGIAGELSTVMREAQPWCASILETHLAYPILAYFRSSHDYESWIGTLGTLLDAAVLMMTTVDCEPGEARITYNLGRHAAHDLAHYFGLNRADEQNDPRISPAQFDEARARLANAGYTLVEREKAWQRFSRLRGAYATHLNELAAFFEIPSLQWLGRRPLIESEHMRNQLDSAALERIDSEI